MSLPRFLDISTGVLQENVLGVRFGGDTAFSFPVLTLRGGELMDAMFMYNTGAPADSGPRPFGWLLLHSATGKTALLANCGVQDFVDSGMFPLGTPVSLGTRQSLSDKERATRYRELYEVYEELRLFAFEPDPADWQRAAMDRYGELFLSLAPVGHDPFYKALGYDFFRWLGLLEEVPLCAPGPQAAPEPADGQAKDAQNRLLDTLDALTALLSRGSKAQSREAEGEERVLAALASLERKLDEKLAAADAREALVTGLHAELQEHRNNLLLKLTQPIERDIIKVIDDIGRTIEAYRGKQPTRDNYNRFFYLLEGISTDLGDILYRQEVEPYQVEGDAVDTGRQQILDTVATDDAALDKTVARRHGKGWRKGDKIIRPERVSVYVCTAQSESQGE